MIIPVSGRRTWPHAARLLIAPIPFAAILLLIELAAVLALGEGRFSYIVDDAYIHLALSEEMSRGGHGINPGELAAPSSSILWPLLLAPYPRTPLHPYLPLILNCGLALASALTLRRLFASEPGPEGSPLLQDGLVTLLLVLGSVAMLVFLGMEHLLQSWLGLLILLGACLARSEGRTRWWLWAALALSPLVRLESLSLTVPFAILLWRMGHGRRVLAMLAVLAAAVLAHAATMRALGLPVVPSSVLVKAELAHSDWSLGAAAADLVRGFFSAHILLRLSGLLLLVALLAPRHRGPALALTLACMLHFVFGLAGYAFGRYEAYLLIAALALAALAGVPVLASIAGRLGPWSALAAATLAATPFWPQPVRNHAYLPLAAANIAAQQHQMHRFATAFVRGPVAVNDLGAVSYRNDHYVLDLWGLGSEEARRKRIRGEPGWAEELLRRHDVALMMIYDDWLGLEVPEGWVRLGRLTLTRARISPAHHEVSFYARPDRAAVLRDPARLFARDLPAGASFEPGE